MKGYMKYLRVDNIFITLMFLFSGHLEAQEYKENISIVQFSAEFVKDQEISLKSFNRHSVYTFYLEKKQSVFTNEKIKFLPTVIVYENGKEKLRIESNIRLKLPDDTKESIQNVLDEILNNKF